MAVTIRCYYLEHELETDLELLVRDARFLANERTAAPLQVTSLLARKTYIGQGSEAAEVQGRIEAHEAGRYGLIVDEEPVLQVGATATFSGDVWATRVVRDSNGIVSKVHTPANATAYTHTAATAGITSSTSAGLVYVFDRATTGDFRGFLEDKKYQKGTSGSEYYLESYTYTSATISGTDAETERAVPSESRTAVRWPVGRPQAERETHGNDGDALESSSAQDHWWERVPCSPQLREPRPGAIELLLPTPGVYLAYRSTSPHCIMAEIADLRSPSMILVRPFLFALSTTLFLGCRQPARAQEPPLGDLPGETEVEPEETHEDMAADDEDAEPSDPTKREVPLPSASDGWNVSLVIDNGETGIWTVESYDVFPQYAAPEIVGLDDKGACHVLVSYSGKWTPQSRVYDGKWLGGLDHGDVDPRVPGAELYTGGMLGNLYQLVPYPHGALDSRLIAHFPGKELHTIVSGDLDPRTPGAELLVFTRPGGLYRVTPTGEHGTFESTLLEVLPGRVRDAIVLPARRGRLREIATVSRAGWLRILSITEDGTRWSTVHEETMGKGRLALRSGREGELLVLYSSMDDGRILRHERGAGEAWKTETIYAGPQGVRGIAAGQFNADPGVETLAVFGYSGKVQLLSRGTDGWKVETVFVDRDKGHWLSTAEVDGRNGTREIIGSGYGARVFLVSRPPGYGLEGIATDPAEDH